MAVTFGWFDFVEKLFGLGKRKAHGSLEKVLDESA